MSALWNKYKNSKQQYKGDPDEAWKKQKLANKWFKKLEIETDPDLDDSNQLWQESEPQQTNQVSCCIIL